MVTVVVTTYNPTPDAPRYQYLAHCIDSFSRRLHSPEDMDLLIADDGSLYPGPLNMLVRPVPRSFANASWITGPHNGIGSSLNRAMEKVSGPWMYTTDDWRLTGPLDLALPLWLLGEGYDIVRLGPLHPNITCSTVFQADHGWWLDLDIWSNEFVYGTRPFLASGRVKDRLEGFLEGVDSYVFEKWFCEACTHLELSIAATQLHGPWETIGDDYPVGSLPVVPTPAFPFGKGGDA